MCGRVGNEMTSKRKMLVSKTWVQLDKTMGKNVSKNFGGIVSETFVNVDHVHHHGPKRRG